MEKQRNFIDLLFLCLRSRCPVCGQGQLFIPFLKVNQARDLFLPPGKCNICQFIFRREAGYYFGVLTPTLSILALGTGILFAAVSFFALKFEFPDFLIAGGVGILFGLFIFFRTSIAVFIAFDHAIDPVKK